MLRFSARPEQNRVLPENAVQESCPETGIHTNSKTLQVFSKELEKKDPFKSSRAAVLISEDTGLLASSFIFTERESFLA